MGVNIYVPKDKFIEIIQSKLVYYIIEKQDIINSYFILYQYNENMRYSNRKKISNMDRFLSLFIYDKFLEINALKHKNNDDELKNKIENIGKVVYQFDSFVNQLVDYTYLIQKNLLLEEIPIPYPTEPILLLFEEKIRYYPDFHDILNYVENKKTYHDDANIFSFLVNGYFD